MVDMINDIEVAYPKKLESRKLETEELVDIVKHSVKDLVCMQVWVNKRGELCYVNFTEKPKKREKYMKKCKYYTKHLETIREYIGCLYSLEDCGAGGMLHILLDDNNFDDDDILYCLKECLNNPEAEESTIGKLICEDYLKLLMPQRRLLTYPCNFDCNDCTKCKECEIENGFEWEE